MSDAAPAPACFHCPAKAVETLARLVAELAAELAWGQQNNTCRRISREAKALLAELQQAAQRENDV